MYINKPWHNISSLKEPFNDAINYKSKDQKEFFSKIFVKTEDLNKCLEPNIYYLMGEKGTGKTAYAVYLENNTTNENLCKLTTMTETQYKRFIALKQQGKLAYSDYANIWRSIFLLLISQVIVEKSKRIHHIFTGKFSKVEEAIEKWNKNALNPEIESAFEMLNSEMVNAKLSNKNIGEVGAESKKQDTEKSSTIKHHLLETETTLKTAISSLKLAKNHILFIDGIDFKPVEVPYTEYIECIKGLAEAAWQLNTEYLNSIKDSKGRIKIVLLIRPDVFHAMNLYNSNSRLQDNCVFLNWFTTEREYMASKLFNASDKYFANQQTFKTESAESWNQYFTGKTERNNTFKNLLKTSFHKPRDILTFIKTVKRQHTELGKGNEISFQQEITDSQQIKREYADYLLGEVKNFASFYMSDSDFSSHLKFFQYLNGKPIFSVEEFQQAFIKFKDWADKENIQTSEYLKDHNSLLQFFFEVNIIGYKEVALDDGESFYHWAFKERTINNISPKVKSAAQLMINIGISKALDIGKETSSKKPIQKRRKK